MTLVTVSPAGELELWLRKPHGSWRITVDHVEGHDVICLIKYSGRKPEYFGRVVLGEL